MVFFLMATQTYLKICEDIQVLEDEFITFAYNSGSGNSPDISQSQSLPQDEYCLTLLPVLSI